MLQNELPEHGINQYDHEITLMARYISKPHVDNMEVINVVCRQLGHI